MSSDDGRLHADFAALARVALAGRPQDAQALLQRMARYHKARHPDLSESLTALLREGPTKTSPLRRQAEPPAPVDVDTRLPLVRVDPTADLHVEPVFTAPVDQALKQIIRERRDTAALISAGLQPSRTALFTGPPGVGKTLAAKHLARALDLPLLVLDLAAVMSSYLGRTGGNLRHVMDYAKSTQCVLLLDEVDAIAKRRDDGGEVGELKRLVTVLLQEVDDWPASGLLIAATNHPGLLDPALWRRFDAVVAFPLPDGTARAALVQQLLNGHVAQAPAWAEVLAVAWEGRSFSDIEREILRARRVAVLDAADPAHALVDLLSATNLPRSHKFRVATALADSGLMSQRRIREVTGVARDTVRARSRKAIPTL